jgi:type IV pilus assembly protein PilB
LDRRLVSEFQLDAALRSQKDLHDLVGNTLVKMGFITERDVMIALGIQWHLPYIALDKCQIQQDVLNLVPRAFAHEHHIMPLDKVGTVLSVVTDRSLERSMVQQLRQMTHCEIACFVATTSEIEKAIRRWYH